MQHEQQSDRRDDQDRVGVQQRVAPLHRGRFMDEALGERGDDGQPLIGAQRRGGAELQRAGASVYRGAQVLHQMEAVSDLNRIRRTLPGTFGKRASTVTCNDFHTGMRLQPGRQSHGTGIGKQLKRPIRAEIDQDGFEV